MVTMHVCVRVCVRACVRACVCVFAKNGGRGASRGSISAGMHSSSQSYLCSNNQPTYCSEAFTLCSQDISWIIQTAAKGGLKAGKCTRVTRRNVSQSAPDLGHTCLICCVLVWAAQSPRSVAQIGLNNDAPFEEKRLSWSNLRNKSRSACWGASVDDPFLRFVIREFPLACPNFTPLRSFPYGMQLVMWWNDIEHKRSRRILP